MRKRILVVGAALVVILLTMSAPGWAAPKSQARAVVTYPTNGMTIGGAVEITGIATHPNMNFYQLRYAAGPQPAGDSQWVDFAIIEGAVEDGVLAIWDTTGIPNGQYTLALAVWGIDDGANPYLFFVTNLTVDNTQVVPTPTPALATPEPLPTAVVGPSPTPITIEQPATSTPRPSPTPQDGEGEEAATPEAGEEDDSFDIPFDFSLVRTAFYAGGLVAVTLFTLWGLYLLLKALVRWLLRQRASSPWK
jgi:hypothetical protein